MYKVSIPHLEKINKALELAEKALISGKSTKNTLQEISESKKLLKENYLAIKPLYL